MFKNLRTLGEYHYSLHNPVQVHRNGPGSTAKTRRKNMSRCNSIVVAAVLLSGIATSSHAVDPNEVCIFEHIDYVGQRACFRVEPTNMRHKLVPTLGNMNDRASSVLIGSGVFVQMYQDAHYSGRRKLYSDNKRVFGDPPEGWPLRFDFGGMNDVVSSLIVVPRHTPLSGVYLVEGSDSFRKMVVFYPLPEHKFDYIASFPKLDRMSMNDVATKVLLAGDVSVDLYEHANFRGKWIRLPSNAHSTKQIEFELKPYQFDGITSSLKVRAIR